MSERATIICNPRAGRFANREDIRARLLEFPQAEIRFTKRSGDAARFAREALANGSETVIAAGGDGTLNEVLNGLASDLERVRVGLIPLGTGNDFAKMMNLPPTLEECVATLARGETRAIDLVRARLGSERFFINVSAGGFSGAVNEKLTPGIKQSWGPLAYLRSAAEALPDLRAYATEIVLDDATTLTLELYNAVIANGRFVAGGTPIAPEAAVDDGLLDIVLVPKGAAGDLALVAAQIAMGRHLTSDKIVFRRAARVSVKSEPGMWFNADGELIGNEPAVFEILPRALNFLVGASG